MITRQDIFDFLKKCRIVRATLIEYQGSKKIVIHTPRKLDFIEDQLLYMETPAWLTIEIVPDLKWYQNRFKKYKSKIVVNA